RNGQPVDSKLFTGPRRLASLDELVQRIVSVWQSRRGLLDEQQARAELHRLTGQHPQRCDRSGCGEVLPLGRRVCLMCRASAGRVAAGMLSGVRRRGDVVMPPPPTQT
ncbi:hypothetical protein, partial [Salinispora arenicola]|uniref:hypothetical protein n=1 Tax=Salinispora arenicola TaxID=168697 RepID=UPI0005779512